MKITKQKLKKLILEKFNQEDFKDVYSTAQMAHMGQKRRSGEDYFTHPSEVRNIVRRFYPSDKAAQLVALLHDSIEDAPGSTVKSAAEMEEFIRGSIQDPTSGQIVVDAVKALTHEKYQPYSEYVLGLLAHPLALRVKLADMVHNLSATPSDRQKEKYKKALEAISLQTSGKPPSSISSKHWTKLFTLTEDIALIREYVRATLKESVNFKIMSMIDKAETAGYKIRLFAQKDGGSVTLTDPSQKGIDNAGLGRVEWITPANNHGACSLTKSVAHSKSIDGFGPLLYDVAIEASGGLMADRFEVSGEAEHVWNQYNANRPDVQVDQLDILDDYGEEQLTPDDPSDDCSQVPAHDMYKDGWMVSSLSKRFSKDGTPVIDELIKRSMLIDNRIN